MRIGAERRFVPEHPQSPAPPPWLGEPLQPGLQPRSQKIVRRVRIRHEPVVDRSRLDPHYRGRLFCVHCALHDPSLLSMRSLTKPDYISPTGIRQTTNGPIGHFESCRRREDPCTSRFDT